MRCGFGRWMGVMRGRLGLIARRRSGGCLRGSLGGAAEAGVQELGAPTGGESSVDGDDAELRKLAGMIRLEIVEPARAVPILCEADWRDIEGYAQVWEKIAKPQAAAEASRRNGDSVRRG